jgi:hypothetical protein
MERDGSGSVQPTPGSFNIMPSEVKNNSKNVFQTPSSVPVQ